SESGRPGSIDPVAHFGDTEMSDTGWMAGKLTPSMQRPDIAMKPLHVGLLVVEASVAGGLAVRMTQPVVFQPTPASTPTAPAPTPTAQPPVVPVVATAPPAVYAEEAPAPKISPIEAPPVRKPSPVTRS